MTPRVVVAAVEVLEAASHWAMSWSDLILEVAGRLIDGPKIDAVICAAPSVAHLQRQGDPAAIVADRLGLIGVPAFAVDCGQASSAAALNLAWTLLARGAYREVLVVGAAKTSDHSEAERLALFDRSLDQEAELAKGLEFSTQAALLAGLCLREPGASKDMFASITAANKSAWARGHGQRELTVQEIVFDLTVAPPLVRSDFPQVLDGAGAARLRAADPRHPARLSLAGVATRCDIASPFERPHALDFAAVSGVVSDLVNSAGPFEVRFLETDVSCSVVDFLTRRGVAAALGPKSAISRINELGGAQGRGYVDGQGALYQLADLWRCDLGAGEGLAISVSGLGGQVYGSRIVLGSAS